MENTSNVNFISSFYPFKVFFFFILYRYRRKPELYGIKAQFGAYFANVDYGFIRVGDRIQVLSEDKNF